MPVDLKWYSPEWNKLRKERLAAAHNRCEGCGIADRSIRESAQGEPYMVYLSIAHCHQYETWKNEAETMVLCQRCHRRYDRQFRRKPTERDYMPIGYASLFVEYQGRKVLAGVTRTVEQLRAMLATVPARSLLEIQVVVLTAVVGNGHYTCGVNNSVSVVVEHGACLGLGSLLGVSS